MKNKVLYKIVSTLVIIALLSVTINFSVFAKSDVPVTNYSIVDNLMSDGVVLDDLILKDSTLDDSISNADVEILAKSLELMYETGQVTQGNKILGFNKEMFEEELQGIDNYEETIESLEENDLFVEPTMTTSTYAVPCDWYLMKEKPSYVKAQNKCIKDGLKSNYGPVTVLSTIANLINDKEFKLAAKKILALGIKSNVAGIVVTLSYILITCNHKMDKKFPGKSNCY